MRNKRGLFDLILISIVFVVFTIAGGIIWFVMSSMNTEIMQDPDMAGHTESIMYAEQSFGFLNWGSVLIFVVLIISMLISYYKIGSAPWVFIIHIFIIAGAIWGAMELANQYYELSLDPDLNTKLQTDMVMPYYVILYYPMIIGIIGFISSVVLVAKWAKDRGSSQSGLPISS